MILNDKQALISGDYSLDLKLLMVEIGTYNLNKMFKFFFRTIFPLPLMKSIYYTSTDLTIYIAYNVEHQLCIFYFVSQFSLSSLFLQINSLIHFHFRNLEFRKLPITSFSFSRLVVSELINSLQSPCKPFISICLSGLTTKD